MTSIKATHAHPCDKSPFITHSSIYSFTHQQIIRTQIHNWYRQPRWQKSMMVAANRGFSESTSMSQRLRQQCSIVKGARRLSPWSPLPFALVQEGGGDAWGLTTGAKALFCFTAEMTLAGENEKMPCVLLQFEERLTEEAAMVGLDGTTAIKQT